MLVLLVGIHFKDRPLAVKVIYKDSDSQDAIYANSRIAYFYSCIVDKLLKENEELRQLN